MPVARAQTVSRAPKIGRETGNFKLHETLTDHRPPCFTALLTQRQASGSKFIVWKQWLSAAKEVAREPRLL
jgi:hypothetical protein